VQFSIFSAIVLRQHAACATRVAVWYLEGMKLRLTRRLVPSKGLAVGALLSLVLCTPGAAAAAEPDFLNAELRLAADQWLLRVEAWGYSEPSTRKYLRSDGSIQVLRDSKRTKQWKVISYGQLPPANTVKAYEAARTLMRHFEVLNRSRYLDDDAAYEVTLITPRASFHVWFGDSELSNDKDKVLSADLSRLYAALGGAVSKDEAQNEPQLVRAAEKQRILVIRKSDLETLKPESEHYAIMLYDSTAAGRTELLADGLKGTEASVIKSLLAEMRKSFDLPPPTESVAAADAKPSRLMIVLLQSSTKRHFRSWLPLEEALHLGMKDTLGKVFEITNAHLERAGSAERLPPLP
jgi:hypothetical protein